MPNPKTPEFYLKKYNITEEQLRTLYIENEYSLPDFYKKYGMAYRITKILLNHFQIPQRTHRSAVASQITRNKRKNTCIKKYGIDNPSQIEDVKEKKRQTFLKNYSVDNIWKLPEYYQWLDNYMLTKYGKKRLSDPNAALQRWEKMTTIEQKNTIVILQKGLKKWWNSLTDEQKSDISAKACSKNLKNSKLESRISNILTNLNISHVRQFRIKNRFFDFLIYNTKILLEINGDFWHANPQKYNYNSLINFPYGKTPAYKIWEHDREKCDLAEKTGYEVLVIWENDMKEMDDSSLEEHILKILQQ